MEFKDILTIPTTSFVNFSNSSTNNFTLNQTMLRNMIEDTLLGNIYRKKSIAFGLVVLYVPAFLFGFFGNGCLTAVILSKRRLWNLTNLFLCNLAIADLSGKL